jgi:omega-6 fatty acid desaturase / acyl-lipid omega-6 desaturase (Delta-12 desaturase)
MGKGGESSAIQRQAPVIKKVLLEAAGGKQSPLASKLIEELRLHATQFGLSASGSREDLLARLDPYAKGLGHRWAPPAPLPLAKPEVTFSDVRKALPKHLFKRDMLRSFKHLFFDLALIAALGYAATWISHDAVPFWARLALWPIYIFCQGTALTGVWVLAHECGHQAFSESEAVNNAVGLVCHSALLVPYHSWRITHGKHHNNTGSCEHDEVFCPTTRSSIKGELLEESPLVQAFFIMVMLTVGWMPGYLVFNMTGPKKYSGEPVSHFNPWAKFFDPRDRLNIVLSDLGFFTALAGIVYAAYTLGAGTVALYYGAPYMVCNLYLVLITYLQHTDVFMPHFRGDEWSWFRGALCTVDRTFGAVIDHTIHHIADTHVCHHIFSKMPFYNAQEATEILKEVLGDYYLSDNTPIPQALWRSYTCCAFVEDEGTTVFYKSKIAK